MLRFGWHLAAAAGIAALVAPVEAKELNYGSGVPAKSETMAIGITEYLKDVEKQTKGSLTFKLLAGSQVVTLNTTLAGLRDGTIDLGFVVPVFTRKELVNTNVVYDTQVFGTDSAAITGAVNDTILFDCKECLNDYKRNGAVYIASYGNEPYNLICRNKVTTVAELKGLKIRAVGATTRLVSALGGVPVSMDPPEATTSLQRGGLDCVHGVVNWLQNFGYWDVAKHVVEYPLGSPRVIGAVTVGRRAWDGLSADHKRALIDNAPMALARLVFIVNKEGDAKIKNRAIKEKGISFSGGGRDFDVVLDKFRESEAGTIADAFKKQGVKNPEAILAAFKKNLAKWEKISKDEIKDDMNALARALKREIFDKVDAAKL